MALEDRRAFDAGILQAATRSADAATRARGALAAGRIGDPRGAALIAPLPSLTAMRPCEEPRRSRPASSATPKRRRR